MNTLWRWLMLVLVTAAMLAAGAAMPGCDDDDDDDNQADDDDDDDDNDDNDDNDDDTVAPTCEATAAAMIDICQIVLIDLNAVQGDQTTLTEWCLLSEELFPEDDQPLTAPFWLCMYHCCYEGECAEACFDTCLAPEDPGEGCGSTVHGVYACGVVWVFVDTDYWIPEMDMQAACIYQTDVPWDCYADCVAAHDCSYPPTQPESTDMIQCLTACDNAAN